MNYITFDIETHNPVNPDKFSVEEFRVSVAGAYISWEDRYVAFIEDDVKDLIELMKYADLIVGYNQLHFDLPVLQKYADFDLLQLTNYDMLVECQKSLGFRLKLDSLCKGTLGSQKTDSYQVYKHYYKDGKWAELVDYCMHDVFLTEQLFRISCRDKQLFYDDLGVKKSVTVGLPSPKKITIVKKTTDMFGF